MASPYGVTTCVLIVIGNLFGRNSSNNYDRTSLTGLSTLISPSGSPLYIVAAYNFGIVKPQTDLFTAIAKCQNEVLLRQHSLCKVCNVTMEETSEEAMEGSRTEDRLARQTSSDVKLFKKAVTRAAEVSEEIGRDVPEHVVYEHYGDFYNMTGDKYLVVLNQHDFKSTVYFNYQKYSPRRGTFSDVASLQKTFGDLGFKVTPYNDLEYDDIMDTISNLCKADHKNTSCIAIAILTHGERGGEVCAADRPYPVNDIMSMLQRCAGLAGKPKLVFVQACRGQKVDEGQRITLDGDEVSIVIPTHADCLVLYSSFEDHLSYRDTNGSWMIQALCSVISENHESLDILQMMTLVHRAVALRFTNTPTNKAMHNKKQMPEARFTLTKFLKFSSM